MDTLGSKLFDLNRKYTTINTDIDISQLAPPSEEILSIEPNQITEHFLNKRKFKIFELQHLKNKFEVHPSSLWPVGVQVSVCIGTLVYCVPRMFRKLYQRGQNNYSVKRMLVSGSLLSLGLIAAFGGTICLTIKHSEFYKKKSAYNTIDEVEIIFLSVCAI